MQFRSIKLDQFLLAVLILLALFAFWTIQRLNRVDEKLGWLKQQMNSSSNINSRIWPGGEIFKRRPKILCWILSVQTEDNINRSQAVRETWGKRCDRLIIVRNGTKLEELEPQNLLILPVGLRDSRQELWRKVVAAFTYIRSKYLDQFDWFMKADDDTYVLVEFLRSFLARSSPERPIYYGSKFKPFVKQGYMSGGAGYVLSRAALRLLVDEAFNGRLNQCNPNDGSVEDVEMGQCLETVGVEAGDTRDESGKPTFLALSPISLINSASGSKGSWYYDYAFYKTPKAGKNCCSAQPITFHYISPEQMRFIDWLLYQVRRPIVNGNQYNDNLGEMIKI